MSVMVYFLLKDDLPKLLSGEELPLINGEYRAFQLSILDGLTNGDVIKALFPDIKMWGESEKTLDYSLGGMVHRVLKSWWDAPYKIKPEEEVK